MINIPSEVPRSNLSDSSLLLVIPLKPISGRITLPFSIRLLIIGFATPEDTANPTP